MITKEDIKILKESLEGLNELEEFQEGWEPVREKLRELITKLEKDISQIS